jgi:hypothetical protein
MAEEMSRFKAASVQPLLSFDKKSSFQAIEPPTSENRIKSSEMYDRSRLPFRFHTIKLMQLAHAITMGDMDFGTKK